MGHFAIAGPLLIALIGCYTELECRDLGGRDMPLTFWVSFNFIPDLQSNWKYLGNVPATLLISLFPFSQFHGPLYFLPVSSHSVEPYFYFHLCWQFLLHFLTILFDYIRYTTHQ